MPVHEKTLLKSEESWYLTNDTFFFFALGFGAIQYCVYSTVKRFLDGLKKLNVHAARDGTAAGRCGGAPREHLIIFRKLYLVVMFLYSTVKSVYVDFQKKNHAA